MKPIFKKALSAALAAAMAVSMAAPAFAETQSIGGGDLVSGASDKDVEVKASISSTFNVTIPKGIVLVKANGTGSGEYSANFTDTVSGDIGESEKVTVTPDSTVSLSSHKANATATALVTLGLTEFDRAAAAASQTAMHSIAATLTPGSWFGTMNVLINVTADAPGLYSEDGMAMQTLYNGESATWENLQKTGYITIKNGVLSAAKKQETVVGTAAFAGIGTFFDAILPRAYADTLPKVSGELVLPSNGSITVIADNAFDNSAITTTSMVVPVSVTTIGKDAMGTTANMFYGCCNLASLDLSSFNTRKVVYMNSMFGFCTLLTSLNLDGFDTTYVQDMSGMFNECKNLSNLESIKQHPEDWAVVELLFK